MTLDSPVPNYLSIDASASDITLNYLSFNANDQDIGTKTIGFTVSSKEYPSDVTPITGSFTLTIACPSAT